MDNYKLRQEMRECELAEDDEFILMPKSLRTEIEQKLFELDKVEQLRHNYKEVLRDVLK